MQALSPSHLHPFDGPIGGPQAACGVCDYCGHPAGDRSRHRYNACTDPCDNYDGFCACGARHWPEEWAAIIAAAEVK